MLAVQLIKSQIATVKDLGKLLFLQSIVPIIFKNTEKMVFAALVATVKVLDKSVIRCTLREFCRDLARLGVAHTSPDTIRRALLRLEELGYCTIDRRRDGLSIVINLKAMTYWTRTKTSNVIPLPTSISIPYIDTQIHTKDHNSYPLANCEGDLGREINSRVNSRNSCLYPTRAKQYKNWLHPILFTLSMVLKGAPDRNKILATSDIELRALSAGIELTHPSGVPWEHYARHWQELDPRAGGPREMLARNEIIPVLRGITPVKTSAMDLDLHPVEKCEDENTCPEVFSEDRAGIRAIIREYLEQNSGIQPIEPNNIRSELVPPNEIDETDPEMKILLDARARTRARRINDSEGIF